MILFIKSTKLTLQSSESQFEAAILNVGITDVLKQGSNIDVAASNNMNVANECKKYEIKFFSFIKYELFFKETSKFIQ